MSREETDEVDVICMNDSTEFVVIGNPGHDRVKEIMDNKSKEHFDLIQYVLPIIEDYDEYKNTYHWHMKRALSIKKFSEYKIIKIIKHLTNGFNTHMYHILINDTVNPVKLVVTNCELIEGQEFDFNFSNEKVIARFPTTNEGERLAKSILYFLDN